VVAQALLRAQVVEAGNGEDGKEQEGLGDAQLCAFDVWRDDDEGKVWHHVRFVDLDERVGALDRDNVFVDDIAVGGGYGGRTRGSSGGDGGGIFGEGLLDGGASSLQTEQVLDLLFEGLDAAGMCVSRQSREGWATKIGSRSRSRSRGRGRGRRVRGGGAYESRLAELSRRRAGRKTHCLPRRAQRSQMSLRWVRSHRILSEKQFWQVRETRPVAALPADVSRAGGARDMACSTRGREGSRHRTQNRAAAAVAAGWNGEVGSWATGQLESLKRRQRGAAMDVSAWHEG
jgi:hypothetical protein